jgi:hypothetical protein
MSSATTVTARRTPLHVWVVGTLALLWNGIRKRHAVPVFLVSFVSMIVTSIHNFVLSAGAAVMGAGGVAFSAVIFIVALGLWLYARAMAGKEVLT